MFVQGNSNSGQGHVFTISRAFVSCLGCQHFISDWLGKLKPNKLSTGCQNELKGAAVEKATNPGRRFLFFSRLRRSFSRASRANFSWLRRSCARLDKTAMLRRLQVTRNDHMILHELEIPRHSLVCYNFLIKQKN